MEGLESRRLLSGTLHPLDAVPVYHSDPTATAKIYLDFGGAPAQSWANYSVPATPAYDADGDPTTFSDTELANIREIWDRVAEKFSPFNIDVTTQNPGSFNAHQADHIIIGGNGSWMGNGLGGISDVGGFADGYTTAWIFSANLSAGTPKYVAESIAHEAGHTFGLEHQSVYAGKTLVEEYNAGDEQAAPIMGRAYYAERGLWWDGHSDQSSKKIQDDLAILASAKNGFGYRPQDHGQTIATASTMNGAGTALTASGVIATTKDTDTFVFSTGAGVVQFTGSVDPYGPMLDLKLTLRNAAGKAIQIVDTASLGETLTATVPAGTYAIEVASHGSYGDVGQYTLTGAVAPGGPVASLPSPAAASTAASDSGSPLAVPALLVRPASHGRVVLQWTFHSKSARGYVIEQSTDGLTWTPLRSVGKKTHKLTAKPSPAASSEYRVLALLPGGLTATSAAAAV